MRVGWKAGLVVCVVALTGCGQAEAASRADAVTPAADVASVADPGAPDAQTADEDLLPNGMTLEEYLEESGYNDG